MKRLPRCGIRAGESCLSQEKDRRIEIINRHVTRVRWTDFDFRPGPAQPLENEYGELGLDPIFLRRAHGMSSPTSYAQSQIPKW